MTTGPRIDPITVLREARSAPPGSAPGPERWKPPSPETLAGRIANHTVEALLGQGGMGAVYRARQTSLDRPVALKVIPATSAELSERFAREARVLARLRHPGIVAVHDSGSAGDLLWMSMEFVDGANLRQVLATGALSPEEALRLVPQICAALQFAHDQGVVHRDLKPENVLVDADGAARIVDFGLAKIADGDGSLTASGQVLGTFRYMAPEQFESSRRVDHRADIYSLGVLIYEMLTGGLPQGRFEPPSRRVAVDVRMDEVVLRALEREPERRWQRVAEVQGAVEGIASARRSAPATVPTVIASAPPPVAPTAKAPWYHRVQRQRDDRVFAGVAGGLGQATSLPSWVWRVLLLAGLCAWGASVLAYLVLWISIPRASNRG